MACRPLVELFLIIRKPKTCMVRATLIPVLEGVAKGYNNFEKTLVEVFSMLVLGLLNLSFSLTFLLFTTFVFSTFTMCILDFYL